MLEVVNLKKYFTTTQGAARDKGRNKLKAVDGVSFTIKPNQILGLVGESGSGKSTLGKMLVGLHDKTEGKVTWNNRPMPQRFSHKHFREFSQDIQMIFQDPFSALNPRMQLWETLEEPCLLANNSAYLKRSKTNRKLYLQEWLERVGLRPEFYNRYPHEFSGGQQQRIGIARALIQEPKLLICDEPISALDVNVSEKIFSNLLLGHLRNKTRILVTHAIDFIHLADKIIIM